MLKIKFKIKTDFFLNFQEKVEIVLNKNFMQKPRFVMEINSILMTTREKIK